ncbi:hypothetical protein GN160_00310 [Blochmannia endosymbiont of Colobopsis nipponica]|nr:hypothetical protein GN160_00310 [Blochmannia endosymbiont of Colobopsis nipponica]
MLWLNNYGIVLFLFLIWVIGFTLFIDWYCLVLFHKKLKIIVDSIFSIGRKFLSKKNINSYFFYYKLFKKQLVITFSKQNIIQSKLFCFHTLCLFKSKLNSILCNTINKNKIYTQNSYRLGILPEIRYLSFIISYDKRKTNRIFFNSPLMFSLAQTTSSLCREKLNLNFFFYNFLTKDLFSYKNIFSRITEFTYSIFISCRNVNSNIMCLSKDKLFRDSTYNCKKLNDKEVLSFNSQQCVNNKRQQHPVNKVHLKNKNTDNMDFLNKFALTIESKLADYCIKATVMNILPGPVVTRFELNLAPGVKVSRINNISCDLARSLSTTSIRIVGIIPGKPYVGLEVPNNRRQIVHFCELLNHDKFLCAVSPLTIILGKNISGQIVIDDLQKMPHLLIAGTTGSGKSVGINTIILSILYKTTPSDVRFILIDPKILELSVYEGIPHLLTKVITNMNNVHEILSWCISEMEYRYKIMSILGVRNLVNYNEYILQANHKHCPINNPFYKCDTSHVQSSEKILNKLPYIVVIIDEFADLIMVSGKKIEELIIRLSQKARAAGIHLILATQRPSVNIITGIIKANIPARIAFTVSSKVDSRTILDQNGAETLLGMGDMLYLPANSSTPIRIHGAFILDEEVRKIVNDHKNLNPDIKIYKVKNNVYVRNNSC